MKKIRKKELSGFIKSVREVLSKANAKLVKEDKEKGFEREEYEIETLAGKLTVNFYLNQLFVFSIFARFEDVEKVNEKMYELELTDRVNKFSGKWNFHYGYAIDCLDFFESELNRILLKQKANV